MKIRYDNTYEKGYIALLPSIYVKWRGFEIYIEFLFWGVFITAN